ncbi:MAG: SoxR reducing system RseC family protein [Defluviitaleaceae bacterium]|nr:SoxR reducing system RseC family protein [Defluviitaleaceae bacterium]
MGEVGEVIEVNGEEIFVKHQRTGACVSCKICARGQDENEMIMRARNACEATVGDFVEVELQEGALIKAVAMAYGIPFAALIMGFAAGYLIAGEFAAFTIGIVFMILAYVAIKILEKSGKLAKKYVPVAIRKVDNYVDKTS